MLNGRTAMVTGGGQGIGKHAAKTLAENGVKVAVADINPETVEEAAAELSAFSETRAVALDVREEGAVHDALDRVVEEFGGIDILVNNAAIVPHFRWGSPLWPNVSDMPLEFWDRVIQTNLYGTFFCTKHVISHMRDRNGGHVVNLYGGGRLIPPGALAYMVTKNSIRTFTRYIAEEVREANICAVTFSPRLQIATETAPDSIREELPGPDVLGDAFVLAAELPMEFSGKCLAYEDGRLVEEAPMEG